MYMFIDYFSLEFYEIFSNDYYFCTSYSSIIILIVIINYLWYR